MIAARVTEDPRKRVLLLEAGPDYPPSAPLPRDLADGRKNSTFDHDWGLHFQASPEQIEVPLPRGKVVGGSSAVNTCIALRGEPEDYDEWAALGCPAWSWEACAPAFKRLEDDRDIVNAHHGRGGPIPIHRAEERDLTPFQAAFLRVVNDLGFPHCVDHNEPGATGCGVHIP